mgnify:CR=1 FL=1
MLLFASATRLLRGLTRPLPPQTILLPQPSDDPRDPLNWSEWRKTCILLILAAAAFGGDFQSGAGTPLLEPQALEWGMTLTEVNKVCLLARLESLVFGADSGAGRRATSTSFFSVSVDSFGSREFFPSVSLRLPY